MQTDIQIHKKLFFRVLNIFELRVEASVQAVWIFPLTPLTESTLLPSQILPASLIIWIFQLQPFHKLPFSHADE